MVRVVAISNIYLEDLCQLGLVFAHDDVGRAVVCDEVTSLCGVEEIT